MSCHRRSSALSALALAAVFATDAATAAVFTYQGRLDENGTPKAGTVDLRFDAFALDTGGAALNAVPVIRDGVPLTEGVFTVEVDFGANVFTGASVFVQVGVREDVAGNASTLTGFTDLVPRQAVTATPYAQHAANLANDAVGSTQITNGSITAADANTSSASDGLQRRVSGSCASNSAIRVVNADGSVECDADDTGAAFVGWNLTGNAGTDPATNFLGTTDAQPLQFRVDGSAAGRLQRVFGPNPATEFGTNVVWGEPGNAVDAGVVGGTIAGGGGQTEFPELFPAALLNRVGGDFGAVGGGRGNVAGQAAVVAGGELNSASGFESSVGGGRDNVASGDQASVGGGTLNVASGESSVIAGGVSNEAVERNATVGGGTGNRALGKSATIAGGSGNLASVGDASVGGGGGNEALGVYSTVPGGLHSTAGGDYSFAAGRFATVRSREGNSFVPGTGEAPSCADAFRSETCGDEGTFVWADVRDRFFASSGPNQFLVRAAGGVGIEPGSGVFLDGPELANAPEAPLHVFEGSAGTLTAVPDSVAVFENDRSAFLSVLSPAASERGVLFGDPTHVAKGGIVYNSLDVLQFRTGGNFSRMTIDGVGNVGIGLLGAAASTRLQVRDSSITDNTPLPTQHSVLFENIFNTGTFSTAVLALKSGRANPDAGVNFVTFYNSADTAAGAIEGNGAGGVTYKTSGADYAEWLPRVDADEAISPGDLVGLHAGGKVSKHIAGAIQVLIASTGAAVAGNSPGESAEATHTLTAFVGQVQARVCGPVRAGNAILAAEDGSGCGAARDPKLLAAHEFARVAGTAWEGAAGEGEHRVRVAVGFGDGGTERAAMLARIDAQDAKLAAQQAIVDALKSKMAAQQALVDALLARDAAVQRVAASTK